MDKDEPYPYYCPAGGVLPGRFRELPESSAGQDNCQPVKSQVEGFHQVPAVSYQNENGGAARETYRPGSPFLYLFLQLIERFQNRLSFGKGLDP